ncbi:MAG: histidine kinase [Lachnospiraceae bacterium]
MRERNRIAREIHDNVGHMLTRAILMVGASRARHTRSLTSLCRFLS